jgi:hypothetical protein
MVEEFGLSLWLAAGCDFRCDTVLVTMAQLSATHFWLLSQVEMV